MIHAESQNHRIHVILQESILHRICEELQNDKLLCEPNVAPYIESPQLTFGSMYQKDGPK